MYRVYCDEYMIYDTRIEDLKLVSPKLDLELNKTGTFSFTIYPEHPYYNKLEKLKSIIQVFQDNYLIFRGRILNDEQGFYNEKAVTCEGELAFLLDSVQRPYDLTGGGQGVSVEEFFTFLINNHNSQVDEAHRFKVGNVTVKDPNDYIVRADSTYLNTFDTITQKLINSYGGYLYIRHEADGNYIDYLEDFSTLSNQTVEFGSNLLEIKQSQTGEDIATAIIPLGAKAEDSETRLTIESVNDGKDYVYDEDAVEKYGWIFATVEYDDVTTPEALKRKGEEYLAQRVLFSNTIELTAVDLHALNTDISAFKLGTYIRVKTSPHSVEGLFLVNKLSINLLSPSANKLTLGATYSSISDQTHSATSGTNSTIQQIQQDISGIKVDLDVDAVTQKVMGQVNSVIAQNSSEILLQVSENYYLKDETDTLIASLNTEFSQTKDEFNFKFNQFSQNINDVAAGVDAEFEQWKKYIRFKDGNIILGEEGNEITLRIENDKILFLQNGAQVAYFTNRKLYVTDGEFLNSLKIGNFAFIPRANGNLSFKKVV